MIAASDGWGPFRPDIDSAERLARLRSLRALVRAYCGARGQTLCAALAEAETDPDALTLALAALNRLTPHDRRHVLAAFAALSRLTRLTCPSNRD
ncbi:hypothetical protein [Methylobacterium nigriterrae]|uniref:hypothetical protein n=1 Tax=Methylobacterium nigriterrae TaxID=3127512 RepID=UPI003013863E